VRRVPDGDGLELETGQGIVRVRLAGVDAPEIGDRDPVKFRRAVVAKLELRRLAFGEVVLVDRDRCQRGVDRWGRVVGYATRLRDGLQVNAEMIRSGTARPWRGGGYEKRELFEAIWWELGGHCG
jgi:endonuclease YncB( thermonuclease family)